MNKIKKIKKYEILVLFFLSCLGFAIPSIIYYLKNKTILNYPYEFKYLMTDKFTQQFQGIIYLLVLFIMVTFYIGIIQNRKKLFKNFKKMLIYISIISMIFLIVVPISSSDIFYYLGVGEIDGKYGQNPYYTTIKEFVENEDNIKLIKKDKVLESGYNNYWSNTTVVYGPIWSLICKIVANLSLGNIDFGIFIFKMLNIIIHILNCILIYKLTNKKKIFSLIYGLNPFILIEAIACGHNDIYMIFLILASIYFLIKRKNILLSVTMLSLATAIKYFAVILLPFIIIYYFRDEKLKKRFLKCIQYGLIYIFILIISYLIYMKDFKVLQGIFTMQTRIAKNFYLIIHMYFGEIANIINYISKIFLIIFTITYIKFCIKFLNQKQIKFTKTMQHAGKFLGIFLFLLITNFQPWYIMWLFPCAMWQKSKDYKIIIAISILSEFANTIFYMLTENWKNGALFYLILVVSTLIYVIKNKNEKIKRIKNINLIKKQ